MPHQKHNTLNTALQLIVISFYENHSPRKHKHGVTIQNYHRILNYLRKKYPDYKYANLYFKSDSKFWKQVK